jgi:hypothetical protein
MYLLNENGLAQWPPRPEDWPWPRILWPGAEGRSATEDELIEDEIKRGTSVNDLTNKVFWNRRPEFRDCRLPRSCQELEQLQREWALLRAKVATKKDRGGGKNLPKPR